MVNGKREYKRGQALPWEVLFILYEKLQPVCMEIEFPKENQKEKPDNCTKKETRNGTARMDFYNYSRSNEITCTKFVLQCNFEGGTRNGKKNENHGR